MTREENLNKIMDLLEQTSMRDATSEERKSVDDYIKSISKPTGVEFDEEQLDFVQPHNKIPITLTVGDAISRQIISDYVGSHIQEINTGYGDLNKHTNEILRMIVDYIESMPPVTSQPKTGRWISFGAQGEIDGQIVRAFTCSECGAISIFRMIDGKIVNGDSCANCRAKMQEVE